MKFLLFSLLLLPLFVTAQSGDEYYRLGKEAYDKKEYSTAADYFSKALAIKPGCYSYWYRGSCYWGLLQYEKAVDDYSRALIYAENDEDRSKLLVNRADCKFELVDYKGAADDYRQYLKLQPGKPYGHNQLGRSLLGLADYEGAKLAFNNAFLLAENDENRAIYKYNLGLCEKDVLNYAGAYPLFTDALSYDPKYLNVFYRRAEVNLVRKNYSAALADYDKAMDLVTTDLSRSYVCLKKGLVYEQMNDLEKAFQQYKKATDLYSTDEDAWYDLGRLAKTKMKNEAIAISFLQKAADLATQYDTSSTYAYAKMILGQQKEALAYQSRKIERSKGDNYRYKWELHNMACLLSLAGNYPKAIDYVERSLAAGFDDFDHLVHDRDLKPLFNMPQWKAMMTKYHVPRPKY